MADNYPLSDTLLLKQQFIGKKVTDLPTPSILLDRHLIKAHCTAMLQICKKLDVSFRAHVKSHKTLELSRLQVGDGLPGLENTPAQFVVSTVAEAENLVEYVKEQQEKGRESSVSGKDARRAVADFIDMSRSCMVCPSPRVPCRDLLRLRES